MTTSEKVAYLKGLAEGYGLDKETKEGKLLATILDVLEDLALDQQDMSAELAGLAECVDAVSEDLEDVEKLLFDDDEDDGEDEDGTVEDWDGETVYYEVTCPACGETVTFDEDMLRQGGIQCPACGADLEFDLGDEPSGEDREAE